MLHNGNYATNLLGALSLQTQEESSMDTLGLDPLTPTVNSTLPLSDSSVFTSTFLLPCGKQTDSHNDTSAFRYTVVVELHFYYYLQCHYEFDFYVILIKLQ